MKRPTTSITIIPVEGEIYTLQVPQGECEYWSKVVNHHLGDSVMGIDWSDETPNLPYLGHIALSSDDLAREWLVDQHVKEVANG